MIPAFRSQGQIVTYLCTLALLLLLPVALMLLGYGSRSENYKSTPEAAGPVAAIGKQIFEERGDIDLLFLGDSLIREGIDLPTVRNALEARLGHKVNVLSFGCNWPGLDRHYVFLRDLLRHRRVKMVVLSMPTPRHSIDKTHTQGFRWLRFGEDNEVFDGMNILDSASVYAAMVFGGPRQLLNRMRPNRVADERTDIALLQGHETRHGYLGAKFVSMTANSAGAVPRGLVLSEQNRDRFRFDGTPLGSLQRNFALLLGNLLHRERISAAIVHIPRSSERASATINEREHWPSVLPGGEKVSIIGTPPSDLWAGMEDEEINHYYYDEHMNSNGRMRFTRSILPILLSIYERTVTQS